MASLSELYARQAAELERLERKKLRETLELFAKSKRGLVGELMEYEGQVVPSKRAIWRAVDQLSAAFREHLVFSMTDAAAMGQGHIVALGGVYRGTLTASQYMSAVATTLRGIPESVVKMAMQRIWADGLSLSDRIWRMSAYMREQLENKLVISISQGRTIREVAKDVAATYDQVQDWQALRMVRTETIGAYRDAYREEGAKKDYITGYNWVLSNAEKWCSECIDLASRNPYDKGKEPSEGDTHPNCMCGLEAILMPSEQFVDYLKDKYAL